MFSLGSSDELDEWRIKLEHKEAVLGFPNIDRAIVSSIAYQWGCLRNR